MLWKSKSKESDSSGTQWLISTEDAFDRLEKLVDPERLLDVLNTRLSKEPLRLCIHHVSGHEQKAMPQGRIQRFHQAVQTLPAESGHPLVANDNVVELVLDLLESFGP